MPNEQILNQHSIFMDSRQSSPLCKLLSSLCCPGPCLLSHFSEPSRDVSARGPQWLAGTGLLPNYCQVVVQAQFRAISSSGCNIAPPSRISRARSTHHKNLLGFDSHMEAITSLLCLKGDLQRDKSCCAKPALGCSSS